MDLVVVYSGMEFFSYFKTLDQKNSFTKYIQHLPRSSKPVLETGNEIISLTSIAQITPPLPKTMLTPPSALKVHEPYIRHQSVESTFLVALFLVNQATRFVMTLP